MIRQATSASSAFAMMVVSAASGAAFQYRTTAGGSAASVAGTAAAAPQWVKIARAGQEISGYQSSDGVSWQRVGVVTIAMDASTEVGLVVSSHANTTLSKATFDHVRP